MLPKTVAIASGYSDEPSVVIPWRLNPARDQGGVEVTEERHDVGAGGGMVQNLVGERPSLNVRLSTIERMQNGPS